MIINHYTNEILHLNQINYVLEVRKILDTISFYLETIFVVFNRITLFLFGLGSWQKVFYIQHKQNESSSIFSIFISLYSFSRNGLSHL